MEGWRLLDTGQCSAAENMAFDDVILKCRSRGLVPNAVSFLQFDPSAVLVGYPQEVEERAHIAEEPYEDLRIDLSSPFFPLTHPLQLRIPCVEDAQVQEDLASLHKALVDASPVS